MALLQISEPGLSAAPGEPAQTTHLRREVRRYNPTVVACVWGLF